MQHSAHSTWRSITRFVASSSIGLLWAWRFCSYKTGLLFGDSQSTNIQQTPSYLVDALLAALVLFCLPPLLTSMSLKGKRVLAAGGAVFMSAGTLATGFAATSGSFAGIVAGGVLTGLGSGVLYTLSGLGYVYETTDRLETIIPLNMVWALFGAIATPFLAGTDAGIVSVAILPLCAGAIIWHGLPQLETAQLPNDMNEMTKPSRRSVALILVCTVLFEIGACSRIASPLFMSVASTFGTFTLYYQVISVITFVLLIPISLLAITSSRKFNVLVTFRRMVPLLIIAATMNLAPILPGFQLLGALLNAFANTYLTLTLYIWAFSLAKRGAMSPCWSFSLYMGLMIVGIALGNVIGSLVPVDPPVGDAAGIHVFIMVASFAVLLLILPDKPRERGEEVTPLEQGHAEDDETGCKESAFSTQGESAAQPDCIVVQHGQQAENALQANGPSSSKQASTLAPSFAERFVVLAQERGLTSREIEICLLLAQGRSRPYIREKLVISKSTVDTHARHAYAKLGIHSNQELIDLLENEQ